MPPARSVAASQFTPSFALHIERACNRNASAAQSYDSYARCPTHRSRFPTGVATSLSHTTASIVDTQGYAMPVPKPYLPKASLQLLRRGTTGTCGKLQSTAYPAHCASQCSDGAACTVTRLGLQQPRNPDQVSALPHLRTFISIGNPTQCSHNHCLR